MFHVPGFIDALFFLDMVWMVSILKYKRNSAIRACAKTHRNPRVHIIHILVGLVSGKNVSQTKEAVNTFIISFSKVKKASCCEK